MEERRTVMRQVIAWFRSLWPGGIYAQWWEIQQRSMQQ